MNLDSCSFSRCENRPEPSEDLVPTLAYPYVRVEGILKAILLRLTDLLPFELGEREFWDLQKEDKMSSLLHRYQMGLQSSLPNCDHTRN